MEIIAVSDEFATRTFEGCFGVGHYRPGPGPAIDIEGVRACLLAESDEDGGCVLAPRGWTQPTLAAIMLRRAAEQILTTTPDGGRTAD